MTREPRPVRLKPDDALVVVDVQNDFLPGGALAVAGGDEIVRPLNRIVAAFVKRALPVVATRDWHPADHCSFRERGGPWPRHCVAGTNGAAFASGLALPRSVAVVSKATTPDADAYSGFGAPELDRLLCARGVRRLFVAGLATDYCVLNTVRDALAKGYAVMLVSDAIRAVDVQPGDGAKAIDEMTALGATPLTSDELED